MWEISIQSINFAFLYQQLLEVHVSMLTLASKLGSFDMKNKNV